MQVKLYSGTEEIDLNIEDNHLWKNGPISLCWNQEPKEIESDDPSVYEPYKPGLRIRLLRLKPWKATVRIVPPEGHDLVMYAQWMSREFGLTIRKPVEPDNKSVVLSGVTYARNVRQAANSVQRSLRKKSVFFSEMQITVERIRSGS